MLHMDIGTADDGFSRRTKLWGAGGTGILLANRKPGRQGL
jgi:hypothetical protein